MILKTYDHHQCHIGDRRLSQKVKTIEYADGRTYTKPVKNWFVDLNGDHLHIDELMQIASNNRWKIEVKPI